MSGEASRVGAITRVCDYFDDGAFERELSRRVAFRTESQRPEGLKELHRYITDEMIPTFEAMDFKCRVFENPIEGSGPFLLAERLEDNALPTVLGYGHARGVERAGQARV